MPYENAQSQALEMGGAQGLPTPAAANDPHGTKPPEGQGSGGGECVGTAGTGSALGVAFLFGGIVAQLIQDAEDRRAEVVDCIDWYQRELEKCDRRLESLKTLAQSIQSAD
jgi:hypothetical protein